MMTMKTRTTTAILLTLITLMSIGTAFALTSNSYACRTTCYTNCDVTFTYVNSYDNEIEKDVAHTCAWITSCKHTIKICVTNAYPCYEATIDYTIKNIGNMKAHIDKITINNPNPEALEISITNHECTWITPCEKINGQLTLHLLEEAQQCHTYEFEITIELSCAELQHPRTIGFWKNQFSALYCKDTAQVNSDTLEKILDEISTESQIFNFTGSRKHKFQQALDILNPDFKSNMKDKLKAQLLALWLNYKIGWTTGYTVEGMTAYQIIQGSEAALLNNQTKKFEYWKNLCDGFNNLGE